MNIITNNIPRETLRGYELTIKERSEFPHYSDDEIGFQSFIKYKGNVYDLADFCRIIKPGQTRMHPTESENQAFAGWDGYMSETFFSGLLVKFVDPAGDVVIIGKYFA